MDSWEYLVIHLNVEPPRPPSGTSPTDSGAEPPAAAEGGSPRPVFSESFLKKEFPQFYEPQSGEGAAGQPQHPAQQLQTFLNGHGSLGWELIGVFPVGVLSMLFFRRPKATPQEPAAASLSPQTVPQPRQGQRLPPASELLSQAQLKSLASENPIPSSLASRAIRLHRPGSRPGGWQGTAAMGCGSRPTARTGLIAPA
jgi:hypothetical protein